MPLHFSTWSERSLAAFTCAAEPVGGKPTALYVAGSVYGGKSYLQRWRATINGLEALAAQHCDSLLTIDELAQVDPKEAGESAYMLANGAGRLAAGVVTEAALLAVSPLDPMATTRYW